MQQYITPLDYLILPFILMLVYAIAYRYRNKHYPPNHPLRKYFLPALTVKIIGSIVIGLVYQYYYEGGDTFNYFHDSQIIYKAGKDGVSNWLGLVFSSPDRSSLTYYKYIQQMHFYGDLSSSIVYKTAAIFGLITLNTYLPTAVLFAVLSFTGAWAMFLVFHEMYPKYKKQLTIAIFFIPSVVIWGSGIFKDTICMAALGWLTYSSFQLLIKRRVAFKNIIILALSVYFTYLVKVYIILAFIPALLVWLLFLYTKKLPTASLRISVNVLVLSIIGVIVYFTLTLLGNDILGKYSLENVAKTAEVTRGWIVYASGDEGSAYDIGKINTPADMLLKIPAAINVTLFRPYLWESKKVIVLLSALESFLFLFLFIKLILVMGLKRIWQTIVKDPTLQFCLIFVLIFAFAVGLSTGNFGALSRYKIPCLPFWGIFILLALHKNQPKRVVT